MTNEQANFAITHRNMFGDDPFLKRRGGKWWIDFAGLSFPSPFKTKRAASERLQLAMSFLRDQVRK